jgi:hypothetical protein
MTPDEKILALSLILNRVQDESARHEKLLITGNGELPLVERVRNHEDFIKSFRYWAKFIFGAILIQTIAFAFAIVIAIIRFLPVLEKLANQS